MTNYTQMRRHMTESQIAPNDVYNRAVIEAFEKLPRQDFVPDHLKPVCHADEELQIAPGRFLLDPSHAARMVQAALDGPHEYSLVTACGYGYLAGIMSFFSTTVIGIDNRPEITEKAAQALENNGCSNAVIFDSALEDGYAEQGPYDVIMVDGGAVPSAPYILFDQLKDGGRLFCFERKDMRSAGHAVCYLKRGEGVGRAILFDANLPFLGEFMPEKAFLF